MKQEEILFTEREGRVELDMPRDDWDTLLTMLGFTAAAMRIEGHIPEEHQRKEPTE